MSTHCYLFDEGRAPGHGPSSSSSAPPPLHVCVVEDVSAAALVQSSTRLSTFVWPASRALAQWLWEEAPSRGLVGLRILELGCGTGLVGLVGALLGAEVTFTDSDASALRCVREALRINRIPLLLPAGPVAPSAPPPATAATGARVEALVWGSPDAAPGGRVARELLRAMAAEPVDSGSRSGASGSAADSGSLRPVSAPGSAQALLPFAPKSNSIPLIPLTTEAARSLPPFHLILGADVLYDSALFEPLLLTVRTALLHARQRAAALALAAVVAMADCDAATAAPATDAPAVGVGASSAGPPAPLSSPLAGGPVFVTAYHIRSATRCIGPLLRWLGLRARILPMPSGSPLRLRGQGAADNDDGDDEGEEEGVEDDGDASLGEDAEGVAAAGAVRASNGHGGAPAAKRARVGTGDLSCDSEGSPSSLHGSTDDGEERGSGAGRPVAQPVGRGAGQDRGAGQQGSTPSGRVPPALRPKPDEWEAIALLEISLDD